MRGFKSRFSRILGTSLVLGLLASAWTGAAGRRPAPPGSAATPPGPGAVTAGRAPGSTYGPPLPGGTASQQGDDPDRRLDWYLRQRTYPLGYIPADGYAMAAEAYVRAREAVRRLAETAASSGRPPAPYGLPTGPWAEAGPAPISNAISYLNFGNVAGRVSAVAVHPTTPDIVLVGSSRGGIWRTTNATAASPAWTPVGDGQNTLVIADIKFAPSNPNVVYAVTGDDDSRFWGAGVLKSSNGGATWTRVDNGTAANGIPNGTVLSKLAVDPGNPNSVVAVSYYLQDQAGPSYFYYIFQTADGGATWSKAAIPSGGNQAQFRSLAIESGCPLNLWAINYRDKTINRSADGGATWTAVTTAGLPAFTGNTKLTAYHNACTGASTLYVSVFSSGALAGTAGYPGVYVSTDDGANWSLPGAAAGPSGGCLAQCGYDHELLVDPADSTRLYMLGRDFWTSADGGQTWTNRSGGFDDSNSYYGGNMHVDLHDVALSGSGAAATVWIASDGGIWSYDVAANTFTNRVGNLAISEFMDLAVRPDAPNQAVGGLQDNGSILYGGTTLWAAKIGGDGGASGWLQSVPGTGNPVDGAFTTYTNNVGYKSTDAGGTWARIAGSDSFGNEASEFYGPWAGTTGDNRLWHAARKLYYCDFPTGCAACTYSAPNWICPAWTAQGTTDLAAMTTSSYVSKLAIHNPSAGVYGPFYAANAYPRAFLYSADGLAWSDRTGTLPDRYISRIAFDPAAPQNVWVTLQGFGTGHVWVSPDGGTTWSDRSGTLPNVPVNCILLDPNDRANTWYVATDVGVYGTTDAGAAWTVVGSNLPAVAATDLELDQNRLLYAATGGRSVWTISLAPCTLPGAVGDTLRVAKAGGQATFTWSDIAATGYNVYEDASPAGAFTTLTGSAASGNPGLTAALPAGNLVCYKVAGQNGCGVGPK